MDVVLLDYGAGNLTSVMKAIAAVGASPRVAREPSDLAVAGAIVIPGVGHFDATAAIDDARRTAIRDAIGRGVPLLGICLGLQWLFDGGTESRAVKGLGVFPGECFGLGELVRRTNIKVPHVGWNSLDLTGRPSRLLAGLPAGALAYFTHSFAAPVVADTTATTTHGVAFSSVVERGRLFGAQFHPEKSGATGLRVLANFVATAREAR